MQKQILCAYALLTASLVAMEKESKIPLQLTHQSPEITRIHSQDYLKWLEKQADRKTISCNSHMHANCGHEQLAEELQSVKNALKATNNIIRAKKSGITTPYFSIFSGDGNSFTSNKRLQKKFYHNQRIAYATIPIVAAHALQTDLFKRILIIDENLDNIYPKNIQAYYKHGNGSLFYNHPNEATALLFNNKIVTRKNVDHPALWNFLNNDGKDIDLVFYNIDIETNEQTDQRKQNIFSLFQKCIPTVFIISDSRWAQTEINCLFTYIAKTASHINSLCIPGLKNNFSKLVRGVYKIYNADNVVEEMYYTSSSDSNTESESGASNYNNNEPSSESELNSSYSNNTESSDESYDSNDDLDPFVFKITTDINETETYDGANQILLAKKITITDDGVMEVTLDHHYELYSDYKRYDDSVSTASSDVDHDNNGNSSNESSAADTSEEHTLTYQSPEISRIHTQEYWNWVTDNHDYPTLEAGLTWVTQALDATNDIIKKAKNNDVQHPNYSVCIIPDSFYAAGNYIYPRFGDLFAIIPIAAAHALQSGLFEKILIIEEHISDTCPFRNSKKISSYFGQENGSIFFPYKQNSLSDIFKDKIFIQYKSAIIGAHYKIPETFEHNLNSGRFHISLKVNHTKHERNFFYTDLNDARINLAFYNIDEDAENYDLRKQTITRLLEKHIPIVFICSSQSIADDIQNIINTYTTHSDKKGIACKNKFYM